MDAPPLPVILIGGGILAFAALFAWAVLREGRRQERDRDRALAEALAPLGWTWERVEALRERIRPFGALGTARNPIPGAARRTVETPAGPARLFLFHQVAISTRKAGLFTACLAELPRPLGGELVATAAGPAGVRLSRAALSDTATTGDDAFDRRFVVTARPAETASALLDDETRADLLGAAGALSAPLVLQVRGGRFVVHNDVSAASSMTRPEDYAALARLAEGLARRWSAGAGA